MITGFRGAGNSSTPPDPGLIFSLGCGPFLFRKKEMVCKKKPFLKPPGFPNPFLFGFRPLFEKKFTVWCTGTCNEPAVLPQG